MQRRTLLCATLTLASLMSGCAEDTVNTEHKEATPAAELTLTDPALAPQSSALESAPSTERAGASQNAILGEFIEQIDQYYANLQSETETLYQQVIAFAKTPSPTALDNSIKAWEQAHNRYISGRFLVPLFSALTNLNSLEPSVADIHERLDSYPLIPGYLDAVSGYPFSGLIYSDIPITLAGMQQEFKLGDTAYVTLGFHALEVLLKGTDQERDVADFARLKATQDTGKAKPELRRTLYCNLLAEQISQDVLQLPALWRQHMKALLVTLDELQSENLKTRLAKILQEQSQSAPAEDDMHINEHALAMQQDLTERLLQSLMRDEAS